MPESLTELLDRIRRDSATFYSVHEEAICQGIVLPILSKIKEEIDRNWKTENINEVVPQFAVGNGRVDYCLKVADKKAVFIEVKRASENLQDHQEQLLQYAFRDGVEIAVLTNGLSWWLYLPLLEGSWEERRFFVIDIEKQETDAIKQHFAQFLGKDAIKDGSAVENANGMRAGRERIALIKKTIHQAWEQLCRQPQDEALVDLLSDRVESLCGHKPGPDQIAEFIVKTFRDPPPIITIGGRHEPPKDGYTGEKPRAFTFMGESVQVSTWKDVLVGVARALYQRHSDDFADKVIQRQRHMPYFSRNPQGMRSPREIPGSGIWIGAHGSAETLMEWCYAMLSLFEYGPDQLQVEIR